MKKYMKITLLIMVLTLFTCLFISCDNGEESSRSATETSTPVENNTPDAGDGEENSGTLNPGGGDHGGGAANGGTTDPANGSCTHIPTENTTLDFTAADMCINEIALVTCECTNIKYLKDPKDLFEVCDFDIENAKFEEHIEDFGYKYYTFEANCKNCQAELSVFARNVDAVSYTNEFRYTVTLITSNGVKILDQVLYSLDTDDVNDFFITSDNEKVTTVLDVFGAPSLPYFISTEVNKRCLLSEKTTSANVYLGHLKFNANDVLLIGSDDFYPSIKEAKNYKFSVAIKYNGQECVTVADNINYLDSSYDVTMKDMYEGEDYKGTIVNYQKYHEIDVDLASMTGVSYGYINIELIVTLPDGTPFVVMSDTLYYSVTDTEIVFGLCENPILHEGEPDSITSGWKYEV